jgi:hypothetical protein
MEIAYCEQWSRLYSHPHDVLTEEEAERRHETGKLYTALLGDPTKPTCFLEFSESRSVAVNFLDSALRIYRGHSFQEKKPGWLFLSVIRIPGFPNDTAEPNRATVYYVETDGHVAIVRYEAYPTGVGSYIAGREERTLDVTNNWEPFPEFGHYKGLARFDRGISWIEEI